MIDISDDGDPQSIQFAEVFLDRQRIEQGLSRVLVGAIASVHDRNIDPFGQPPRGTSGLVSDHHQIRSHRLDRQGGVFQRFPLGQSRATGREVDRVGRQRLGGPFEAGSSSRRWFEEHEGHGLAPQGRDLGDVTVEDFGEVGSLVQKVFQFLSREVLS